MENNNELETFESDFNFNELLEALDRKDVKKIREICENYNLVDIALSLNSIDDIGKFLLIFKVIPPEYSGELFSYLDSDVQEDIVNKLSNEELGPIIENLYSDDIVDFIQELPANLVNRILKTASPSRRDEINLLLHYKEDSAGSIMTTEFIMLRENMNHDQAINYIRRNGKKAETISYLYVVNSKRVLKGSLYLKDIIYMEDNETLGDVMETDFAYVNTNTDQEEVAQIFKKYDLNAIPVVTNDDRLVGIITADDIIDVIEEEATEDIHMMANVNPLEDSYTKTNAFTLAKNGVVWLVLLMLLSTFTSFIMNRFEDAMVVVPCLSIFIPMLIDTCGNAGNQSSAVIIRALGLGEISVKDYIKVVSKELLTALMVGVVVSLVNFLWINFLSLVGVIDLTQSGISATTLGALVGVAMFVGIFVSKFIGATLPILCKAIKIDPALLAGPMVTTLVDASCLIIYFIFATQIFNLI